MKTSSHKLINKAPFLITLFFTVLLLCSPIFSFIFSQQKILPGYYIIFGTTFCWLILSPFFIANKQENNVYFFDAIFIVLIGYLILNFSIQSFYPISYKYFLHNLGYISCILLFKYGFSFKKKTIFKLLFIQCIVLILVSVTEASWSILQYFEILKNDNKYFSVLGSFFTPSALGSFLSTSSIILIGFFLLRVKKSIHKLLFIIVTIPIIAAIVLSGARASWIGLIVGIVTYVLTSSKFLIQWKQTSKKIKILATSTLPIALIPLGYLLYLFKPDSTYGRWLIYKISFKAILEKPFFGYGLFNFSGYYNKFKANYFLETNRPWEEIKVSNYVSSAMNDYLLVLFETGIIGLLLILVFFYFLIRNVKINSITRVALATLACVGVQALFTSLLFNTITVILGCWAIGILMNQQSKPFIFLNKRLKNKFTLILLCCIGFIGLFVLNKKFIAMKSYIKKETFDSKYIIGHPKVEFNIGMKLFNDGHKKEGIYHLEHAVSKCAFPNLNEKISSFYTKLGNYKKAEKSFNFSIGLEPFRFKPRMDYLNFLIHTNNIDKQIEVATAIIDLPIKIPSEEITVYKKKASTLISNYKKFNLKRIKLKGSLSNTRFITSAILNKKLPYKIYLPPIDRITKKLPIIYINDGFNYIRNGTSKILDSLITSGYIKPVIAVFLEPRDRDHIKKNLRQEFFLCNPDFVNFFTQELIPTIEKKYPVSTKKNDRALLGVSFGGLAAAYIAYEAPDYFKYIAMQSPAFHPCKEIYKTYSLGSKNDFKMYMSYGTGKDTEKQDIPMINILKKKGYDLKVERVENGDHKWSVWKEQLSDIFIYFFKVK